MARAAQCNQIVDGADGVFSGAIRFLFMVYYQFTLSSARLAREVILRQPIFSQSIKSLFFGIGAEIFLKSFVGPPSCDDFWLVAAIKPSAARPFPLKGAFAAVSSFRCGGLRMSMSFLTGLLPPKRRGRLSRTFFAVFSLKEMSECKFRRCAGAEILAWVGSYSNIMILQGPNT